MSTILEALRRLEAEEESERLRSDVGVGADSLVRLERAAPRSRPFRRLFTALLGIALAAVVGAGATFAVLSVREGKGALAWVPGLMEAGSGSREISNPASSAEPIEISAAALRTQATAAVETSKAADVAVEPAETLMPADDPAHSPATVSQTEPRISPVSSGSNAPAPTSFGGTPRVFAPPLAEPIVEIAIVQPEIMREPDPFSQRAPRDLPDPYAGRQGDLEASGGESLFARRPDAPIPTLKRSPLPDIAVKSTVWHPNAGRREVVVQVDEGGSSRFVTMREGETLGPLELSEIRPSGVTFVHAGVEIEYRVGAGR